MNQQMTSECFVLINQYVKNTITHLVLMSIWSVSIIQHHHSTAPWLRVLKLISGVAQ